MSFECVCGIHLRHTRNCTRIIAYFAWMDSMARENFSHSISLSTRMNLAQRRISAASFAFCAGGEGPYSNAPSIRIVRNYICHARAYFHIHTDIYIHYMYVRNRLLCHFGVGFVPTASIALVGGCCGGENDGSMRVGTQERYAYSGGNYYTP